MGAKQPDKPQADGGLEIQLGGSERRLEKDFQSERAAELLAEAYPWLLENCTDEDDEIDTRAAFEVLAGMVGLFIADYQEFYGQDKAFEAFQDLIDLSLNLYEDRIGETEEDIEK